jgi:hypothetical protein
MADECIKIADDASLDPQDRRVRIDTRLKLIGKWNVKVYGESTQLRHADAEGGKLDTQPLVSELLTMLGPGATLQAAVKIEAPASHARVEDKASAFGTPLLNVTPEDPAHGYRPRTKRAEPASDIDDLI